MSERGARSTLMFGGVSVEISLAKTSGKPIDAKHEVRRMIGDRLAEDVRAEALKALAEKVTVTVGGGEIPATMGTGTPSPMVEDPFGATGGGAVTQDVTELFRGLPPERVEQGVYRDDGTFVDLTDRLAEIDARTKIEGMEVVATISSPSVPRHRVRDSYWIGLADSKGGGAKVLALIWEALRATGNVAVVRWTKRTNQALGIIIARGRKADTPALVLLELEWSENMRPPGPRATTPIGVAVAPEERGAAIALVRALHTPPTALNDLRDERTAKRAELLEAAREGRLDEYEAPPEPVAVEASDDIAGALQAAAAAR